MQEPLTPFADDLWIASQKGKFWGVETGSRMAVVKLSSGKLFIYAPIGLTPDLKRKITALGDVAYIVAPSLFHHLYILDWMRDFQDAETFACPGLEWKRPDIPFTGVLGDQPHPGWAIDLDQVYFSARRENEVVFFHQPSKTFLCADSLLNLSKHPSPATRFVARLMGNHAPGKGHLEYVMVRDRAVARRQVDRMLAWDIDRIMLAHGPVVSSNGKRVLREAYSWL